MAGKQGFLNPTSTTSNTTNTATFSAPRSRPISEGRTTTLPRRTNSQTQAITTTTTTTTTRPAYNRNRYENENDHDGGRSNETMWRYSRQSSTFEQQLERRNVQKLQLTANNQVDRRDEETNANKFTAAKHSLVKNSSSEDDEGGTSGEERQQRPNKLFPVRSEQDELFRKVRSVLNKVSSVNYTRLRKRWLSLMPQSEEEEDDGETHLTMEQLADVLHMIIFKALDDTIYMHIYAGLMGYVVSRKPADISIKIRKLINAQLHHLLQRLATDKELALFHRSTQLVDATRRRKVTLHRFIAELYCEKACTSKFLYQRVTDLMIVNNSVDIDENVECLCVLVTFAGQKLEQVKQPMLDNIVAKLVQRQTETPLMISKRIQFMILDLVEMKASGWSPHNKWWSPSVQRAPERERTQSSPSPSSPTYSQRNERGLMTPLQQQLTPGEESPTKKIILKKPVNDVPTPLPRSRTRSEGSNSSSVVGSNSSSSTNKSIGGITRNNSGGGTSGMKTSSVVRGVEIVSMAPTPENKNSSTTTTTTTTNSSTPKEVYSITSHQSGEQQQTQHGQPQQGQEDNRNPQQPSQQNKLRTTTELTPHQSRSLMALLNKVSPLNVDRMAQQLYEEVLTLENSFDEAANFIVDKILDDAFYISSHVLLIHRVSCKPNMKSFGIKICARLMFILEKNPVSKEGFQLIAELYKLNMIAFSQTRSALEWLMTSCPVAAINSAMECLVMFLFISGAKLEADANDQVWMNGLIEFWERKAKFVAHNQGRPLCLLRDVIELRQNKWASQHMPHWIPPTIDLPTVRFEPESLIRLYQSDEEEFLRFIRGGTSSMGRIDKFWKGALKYAVVYGDWERDPEFLHMTGSCLKTLVLKRILRRDRIHAFIGYFVNEVVKMARVHFKAWDNFGVIMDGLALFREEIF